MKKKDQILLEEAYLKIYEAIEGSTGDDRTQAALDATFNTPIKYEEFVTNLGQLAKDSKILAVLRAGAGDGEPNDEVVGIKKIAIEVKNLIPTQNEIDMDKSLKFPLSNLKSFQACFNSPVTIKVPIVTAEGKYVIDGHHRWSQLYAINRDASIVAFDLTFPKATNPLDYLKIVQTAIASIIGQVPVQTVQGTNLLNPKLTDDQIGQYVTKNTNSEVVQFIIQSSWKGIHMQQQPQNDQDAKVGLANNVVNNIKSMRQTSQPVQGAPSRGYMPQTDDAAGYLSALRKGRVNFSKPSISDVAQQQVRR